MDQHRSDQGAVRADGREIGREKGSSEKLITYVKDRPGHDRRYAIDATKINKELAGRQA